MAASSADGQKALHLLKSTDPPLYISPSTELSKAARLASQYLFSSLKPYTPKSPFDKLLVDGFDAEQIWQQIDLQSQPLLSSLRRDVNRFEKNPEHISDIFGRAREEKKRDGLERETEDDDGLEDEAMLDSDDMDEEEEEGDEEGEEESERDGENGSEENKGGVEDRFLKIRELEEYLEDDEAREYGLEKKQGSKKVADNDEDEEEDGEEEDDDDEDDDELGLLGLDDDDSDEGEDNLGNARYEDFFGSNKKNDKKKKPKPIDEDEDFVTGDGESEDFFGSNKKKDKKKKSKPNDEDEDLDTDDGESDGMEYNNEKKSEKLSTYEKELEKQRAQIEEMERANLEPKSWTMQGEVTAAKRPKNSALEVDLDFEHNVRPPPVITEEVTQSLEELIQKRILEGHFDDVQKPPSLPSKAPREMKELDDNKSNKGLGEVYADEYVQKTGLVSAALSFSDEQKKEATQLFKKICLKLDALSHFHFAPKPVIEDMTIQSNVPALAIEEIAPLAVSDAGMLAPEELFSGKGDIKEETELTQAERKRRRANKKRKFKADQLNKMAKKARESTLPAKDGKEE